MKKDSKPRFNPPPSVTGHPQGAAFEELLHEQIFNQEDEVWPWFIQEVLKFVCENPRERREWQSSLRLIHRLWERVSEVEPGTPEHIHRAAFAKRHRDAFVERLRLRYIIHAERRAAERNPGAN